MSNGCNDSQIERCDRNFAVLHEKIDRLDTAIRGNGFCEKPGILERLALVEDASKRRGKFAWLIQSAVITAIASGAATIAATLATK
jgi:hypothetical protein